MHSLPLFLKIFIALINLIAQLASAYDPCGPQIPVDSVTVSTCTAPLNQVYLPAIYGVQCFGNFYPPFLPPNGTDCNDLIPQICAVMTRYVFSTPTTSHVARPSLPFTPTTPSLLAHISRTKFLTPSKPHQPHPHLRSLALDLQPHQYMHRGLLHARTQSPRRQNRLRRTCANERKVSGDDLRWHVECLRRWVQVEYGRGQFGHVSGEWRQWGAGAWWGSVS